MGNILRYLAYLQFLPLLVQLVAFVREAEGKFRGPGSGASKSQWVRDQFAALVATANGVGLISSGLAASLIAGAGAVIDIVVAMFNASGGVPLPEPAPVPDPEPVVIYGQRNPFRGRLSTLPNNDGLKAFGAKVGDVLGTLNEDPYWYWIVERPGFDFVSIGGSYVRTIA